MITPPLKFHELRDILSPGPAARYATPSDDEER